MTREQVRKLLGGYAAGTLTPAEETALFEAALEDQELFDELGREQALRDLLSDPAARAHLLAALDEPRPAWGQRAARWILGNAVGLAAVACFVTVGGYVAWLARDMQKPRIIAEVTEPMRIEVTDSAPEASPQAVRRFDTGSVKRKIAPPSPAPAPPSIALRSAALAPPPALLASALPSSPPPPPATRGFKTVTESVQVQASAAEIQMLALQQQAPRSGVFSFRAAEPAEERPEAAAKNEARHEDALQAGAGSGGGVGSGKGGGVGPGRGGGVGPGSAGGVARGVVGGMAGSAAMPTVIRQRAAFSPPVRYRILKKQPNGAFEPAASAGLSAGDTVKLSIEPNDAGFLSVIEVGSDQPLFSGATQRTGAVTTPEIQLSGAGPKQFRVVFTRERSSAGYPGAPAELGAEKAAADKDAQGPVYSVNSNGSPSGVTFTIALTWR
jgi:hypothetical protein